MNKTDSRKYMYVNKKIMLLHMPNDPDPILPGDTGICYDVDDAGQLLMKWDSGRTLSIIPGVDRFIVLPDWVNKSCIDIPLLINKVCTSSPEIGHA